MTGKRSSIGEQKNRLTKLAKKAEERYTLWCDAGSPPASARRMPGEPEDDRILYRPYRNVAQ
eukprot:3574023-Pyramimonas_sp.AAC.1